MLLALAGSGDAAGFRTPFFVGYFESWSDAGDRPADTELARVAGYVSILDLAFMRPDAVYKDGYLLDGTGLEFRYSGRVLLGAVAELRKRHPGTRIMLGVGGASYLRWDKLDPDAIRRFVQDFGLDGVDIDQEPQDPGCTRRPDDDIACRSDAALIRSVRVLREALPRPLLLSMAVAHVGAYYPGHWRAEMPPGSRYNGISRQPLADPAVRDSLDFINVMGYDAGRNYHPLAAFAAYRELFTGPIAMGVEAPPEYSGDHVYTLADIDALTATVRKDGNAGMMIYSLQKAASPQAGWPDSRTIAKRICLGLALGGCDQPLY